MGDSNNVVFSGPKNNLTKIAIKGAKIIKAILFRDFFSVAGVFVMFRKSLSIFAN